MRLSVIIFNFFFLLWVIIACAGLPVKPSVNLCNIDYPDTIGQCKQTNSAAAPTTMPIALMDKYVAFSPQDWELIQNYINALEQAVQKQ